MKNVIFLVVSMFVLSVNAQIIQTIKNPLKLERVPQGTIIDSLLVRGSDKLVKRISRMELFNAQPAPTLQQVLNSGFTASTMSGNPAIRLTADESLADFKVTGTDYYNSDNLDNTTYIGLYGYSHFDSFGSKLVKLNVDDGLYLKTGNNTFSSQIFANNITSSSKIVEMPNLSGTIALAEFTVGDFINDNATTMAPSQNAVSDALALKANDNAVVKLTGNQTVQGDKTFNGDVIMGKNLRINTDSNILFQAIDGGLLISNAGTTVMQVNTDEAYVKFGSESTAININTLGANNLYDFTLANGTVPVLRSAVPASSTSAGKRGEIFADASFIYICYATNLWRRVAASTF